MQDFLKQYLSENQLKGFNLYRTNKGLEDGNSEVAEGWTIGWGYSDAEMLQDPIFPMDPDYNKGYQLYQLWLERQRSTN